MELFININRLHPLLVHLPIGVLLLAFFMQLYQSWKKDHQFEEAIKFSLSVALIFSILSILTGIRLANEGGYDVNQIFWHKWLGIATAIITALLLLSKQSNISFLQKIYAPLFFIAIGLLSATGHKGGDLTHGTDFLFSHPLDQSLVTEDINSANAFEAVIFPILDNKCIGCHNPSKLKGDLLMTSAQGLLTGGKGGPIFDFETPENSALLQRIHLPLEEKKHMPPKGKKQLTKDEIQILKWWIDNKACFDCRVDSMAGTKEILSLLKKYERTQTNPQAIEVPSISPGTFAELKRQNISISPIGPESNFVQINLSHQKNISKTQIKALRKIGANILELDLSHSNFGDDHSNLFSKLPNLQKLQLQQSQISNRTLNALEKSIYLESLNLYGTKVDDKGLDIIPKIKSLKNIYLWNTKCSPTGIAALQEAIPLLNINYQIAERIFGKSELRAPQALIENIYFLDSTIVDLKSNFPGTKIFFTLNGNAPDSNATIFYQPLTIAQTTKVKFFAKKSGWDDSPVDSVFVIKGSKNIHSVKTIPQPAENYSGKGSITLFDLEIGSKDFKDGNWLGFQGTNFSGIYEFKKAQDINKIYISSLAHQPSWIFFPRGFKIWTSMNGRDYNMIHSIKFSALEENDELRQKIFEIDLPKTNTKFVKIEVIGQQKNPDFHASPGGASWVFASEIAVVLEE